MLRRGTFKREKTKKPRTSPSNVSTWLFFWSGLLLVLSMVQIYLDRDRGYAGVSSFRRVSVEKNGPYGDHSERLNQLSVEIFSAPKPFVGIDNENNLRAIKSWLRLEPKPRITLLGWEQGYDEVAAEYGLNIEGRVDKNFLGVPLFNSMIQRANDSSALITVIINGDILLFEDFYTTLNKVVSTFRDFLIVGARYDVDGLPNVQETDPDYTSQIRKHVLEYGTLHTYGGMDIWAWNTDGPRLFDPIMPHFVFGRGKYDNWLTHETIAAGHRQVVDVSETCLTVHIRHDYHLVSAEDNKRRRLLAQFWSEGKKTKFELFVNIYLSLQVGTYKNQLGSVLYAPWKLALCYEVGGMCLLQRRRPGVCPCEFSSFSSATQTDPVVKEGSRVIQCGTTSVEHVEDFIIPIVPEEKVEDRKFGLPLTLEDLLEKQTDDSNTVILTALNFGYREIMMNWICNMRHLGVSNFIIAALDEDLYKWAFVRGLPVYLETTIFGELNNTLVAHASYGTDAFKQLTKMKSRVVVRLLKTGVNVVWTDCDIIWFKNPLPDLASYQVDLVIQTNAPDDEKLNGYRRINSGFYLAKSNPATIKAFEDIVAFATKSAMSEQPCFWDVMCGKNGENTIGDDRCAYNGMVVRLLDRKLYPNGITFGIWNATYGTIPQRYPDLFILHNNWIKGSEAKQERFQKHGFVMFDPVEELCVYPTTW